jgi:hypothetical protein
MRRALVCCLLTVLTGCSRSPRGWERPAELVGRHARADRLLDAGDIAGGTRELRALWDVLHQPQAQAFPDRRQATQDVAFRLAGLGLEGGDLPGALAYCDDGLRMGRSDDVFTANLLVMRGTIRQDLGQSAAAADDFHQALLINEKLLKQTLNP